MHIPKSLFLALMLQICFVLVSDGQPQYDLRFVQSIENDCDNDATFIDIEIKASTQASEFNVGIQLYNFTFNTTTVPVINPPISPPNTNPPSSSVYITQELTISGSVGGSVFDTHHAYRIG